jgi:hypothetical protein
VENFIVPEFELTVMFLVSDTKFPNWSVMLAYSVPVMPGCRDSVAGSRLTFAAGPAIKLTGIIFDMWAERTVIFADPAFVERILAYALPFQSVIAVTFKLTAAGAIISSGRLDAKSTSA